MGKFDGFNSNDDIHNIASDVVDFHYIGHNFVKIEKSDGSISVSEINPHLFNTISIEERLVIFFPRKNIDETDDHNRIEGFVGEIITGGSGDDYLIGGLEADYISTYGGNDVVFALDGDDIIEISGVGNVVVDTGEGADEVILSEDTKGNVEISTGGAGDKLIYEGSTSNVTYAEVVTVTDDEGVEQVNLVVSAGYDLDVTITNQLVFSEDDGKWVVNGVDEIIVERGDYEDYDEGPVSVVVGSDFREGDLLYSNSYADDNVIFAGEGADTIWIGTGQSVAEDTQVFGDLFNFNYSPGETTRNYELEATRWSFDDGIVDINTPEYLGQENINIKLIDREDGYRDAVVCVDGEEFSLASVEHSTGRTEMGDYYYSYVVAYSE